MSDSGKQIGDCRHGQRWDTCVECEVLRLRKALAEIRHEIAEKDKHRATLMAGVAHYAELLDLLAVVHGDGGHHTEEVGVVQALKDAVEKFHVLRSNIAVLKEALGKAIFNQHKVKQACVDDDPAGGTYELDWVKEIKEWAALADVDLSKRDPFFYARR